MAEMASCSSRWLQTGSHDFHNTNHSRLEISTFFTFSVAHFFIFLLRLRGLSCRLRFELSGVNTMLVRGRNIWGIVTNLYFFQTNARCVPAIGLRKNLACASAM
jgi:hypothetical protein